MSSTSSLHLPLEDLGDDDIALEPHVEVKTCDRFRLITIIRLVCRSQVFTSTCGPIVQCPRLQDLLVLQGNMIST